MRGQGGAGAGLAVGSRLESIGQDGSGHAQRGSRRHLEPLRHRSQRSARGVAHDDPRLGHARGQLELPREGAPVRGLAASRQRDRPVEPGLPSGVALRDHDAQLGPPRPGRPRPGGPARVELRRHQHARRVLGARLEQVDHRAEGNPRRVVGGVEGARHRGGESGRLPLLRRLRLHAGRGAQRVPAAGAHAEARPLHLHLELAPLLDVLALGRVDPEQVEHAGFRRDPPHPRREVVRVAHGVAAGLLGQRRRARGLEDAMVDVHGEAVRGLGGGLGVGGGAADSGR